jgi:hypothetical protein
MGSIIVLLPATAYIAGCGDDDDDPVTDGGVDAAADGSVADVTIADGPGVATDVAPGTLTFTSTLVNGHTHRVTISLASIVTPPPAGLVSTTTVDNGHSHTIELTVAELDAIDANMPVTKMTSLVNEHVHTVTFTRA